MSSVPENADAQLALNRSILIMLGKLMPDEVNSVAYNKPSRAMHDSATELLQFLSQIKQHLDFDVMA